MNSLHETIDRSKPPDGSGIKQATWDHIICNIRELALEADYFWPVWKMVYKKHLRRLAGYNYWPGPASATVFYALYDVFLDAGGCPSTTERWEGGYAK